MNREAAPLIVGIFIPIIIVLSIYLYFSGYDFINYLKKINVIYYILIIPFALGLLVVIIWFRKPQD